MNIDALSGAAKAALTLSCALCAGLTYSNSALALDLGFEGRIGIASSDNVLGVNRGTPEEDSGVIGNSVIGVYGEQKGRLVRGAFAGELDSRQQLDDEDAQISTVSRFLGAAEIQLTPRALSWYVGDILGSVRVDNALQPIDDAESERRRNVFVTGPSFIHDIDGFSRTRARLLYTFQSEEDEELETLYNAALAWERDLTPGSFWGLRFNDIYTQQPSDSDELDFNRASLAAFFNRLRGFTELYGELGVTQYDTDEESLNGVRARVNLTRTLGPTTSLTLALSRDLSDQTLNTVESLIGDSQGVQPEADGFFDETTVEIGFSYQARATSLDLGAGMTLQDYRLLGSVATGDADALDQSQNFVFGTLNQGLGARLRSELGFSFQNEQFEELADERDSVLLSAALIYRLSRSFEIEGGVLGNYRNGRRTDGNGMLEEIDVVENRLTLGIRWAPPSRASKDLTVELKSLLQ